jgi:hypothetical protein
MKEETYNVLRAQRFELVDAANRPWATLGFTDEGEVQFNMLNRDGRGEIVLSFHEEEPELLLFADGNARATLHFNRGATEFSLYDATGTQCIKLHVDHTGAPHILTRKGEDEWTDMCAKAREA